MKNGPENKKNGDGFQNRLLMFLVMFLLTVLTFVSGYSKYESGKTADAIAVMREQLPREYVRLERYNSDASKLLSQYDRLERNMIRIEAKLDTILKNR